MKNLKNWIFVILINFMVIFCFLAFAICVIGLLPEILKALFDMVLGILLGKILLKLDKILLEDMKIENELQRRFEKYEISKDDNDR